MTNRIMTGVALAAMTTLAGCNSSGGGLVPPGGGGGGGGALPVSASGKMLAVRLPGTVSVGTSDYTDTPEHSVTVTSAVATDRTAATGVGISGSADKDPNPNKNMELVEYGDVTVAPALITASADGTMAGGAEFKGMKDAKGQFYFEGGNFGDPQVEAETAAISGVSVYNDYQDGELVAKYVLKDVTTIRYRDGAEGDTEVNLGVGYIGNPTAAMPGSGTATYKGFHEGGIGVYTKGDGTTGQMYLSGRAELAADFGAGKVTGGVKDAQLFGQYDAATASSPNLNSNIVGLAIDATINGSDYAGTAALVDSAGNTVGTVAHGNAIGGFFGANAAETAAAFSIEGNAQLGGQASDYVLQGVIGGVKQ
jgi:hypothetical protein